jgi:hypothetical protein
VLYRRVPRLFDELTLAKAHGTYAKLQRRRDAAGRPALTGLTCYCGVVTPKNDAVLCYGVHYKNQRKRLGVAIQGCLRGGGDLQQPSNQSFGPLPPRQQAVRAATETAVTRRKLALRMWKETRLGISEQDHKKATSHNVEQRGV